MDAVIFAGPSLRAEDRAAFPGLTFLPPAVQGAVHAAARLGPAAIGIIDGFFDGRPAVWHKEILWALSQRIPVFGAASMGALRAAELDTYGMKGIGRIYQDFRDGRLSDDAEVALLHGPAETGYLPLSEPLVNIRATLRKARDAGVLTAPQADQAVAVARSQFYQRRDWDSVLAALPDVSARDALARWLPRGRIDQKRRDALALLEAVRDHLAQGTAAPEPGFHFETTEAWAGASWLAEDGAADVESILDELRLDPDAYRRVRDAALLHCLARAASRGSGPVDDDAALARALRDFRLSRGLLRQADLTDWARRNDLDATGLARLMRDRIALDGLGRRHGPALAAAMLDQVRAEGTYPALRDRARAKTRARTGARTGAGAGDGAAPASPILIAWFFAMRLKRPYPDDLGEYAAGLGFPDIERFCRFVAAEHAFWHHAGDEQEALGNANERSTLPE